MNRGCGMNFIVDKNNAKLRELEENLPLFRKYCNLFSSFSDEKIAPHTSTIKRELNLGKNIDEVVTDSFALAVEATKRVYGFSHHDEQVLGGIALQQGRAVEMKTGEGKTLTAVLPAVLNALAGTPVHIMTANNYLAKRDSEMVAPIFKLLGMTVGYVDENMTESEKKKAYSSNVVYGTVATFGFDYLRDNLAYDKENKVMGDFGFAIVDEADSVLLDQANTPLILSGSESLDKETILMLKQSDELVKTFTLSDYTIDKNSKTVNLENSGIEKAGKYFKIDFENTEDVIAVMTYVQNALTANLMLKKDKDYIVKFGEVVLVDSNTGRPLPSHKFEEGLQHAIEIKEGLRTTDNTKILGTITIQDFLAHYKKLSGMSGTLKNAEEELKTIYKLDFVQIPTHKKVARVDHKNEFFAASQEKFAAIVKDIQNANEKGRPVLVGTSSVGESETLSAYLNNVGIKHNVLNAKNPSEEAMIIAGAGTFGSVTIATDMAGRGTDIKLGGNAEDLTNIEFLRRNVPIEMLKLFNTGMNFSSAYLNNLANEYREKLAANEQFVAENKKKVEASGGLKVIISSACKSKRIEEQLRGRAGRQGDIGESKLYSSFYGEMSGAKEDETLALLAGEYRKNPSEELKQKILSRIETIQKVNDSKDFISRKLLVKLNAETARQQNHFYSLRDEVLDAKNMKPYVAQGVRNVVCELAQNSLENDAKNFNYKLFYEKLDECFGSLAEGLVFDNVRSKKEILKQIEKISEQISSKIDEEKLSSKACRKDFLKLMDEAFIGYLKDIELMKKFFGVHTLSSENPFMLYEKESHQAYEKMLENVLNKFTLEVLEKQQLRQNTKENEIE